MPTASPDARLGRERWPLRALVACVVLAGAAAVAVAARVPGGLADPPPVLRLVLASAVLIGGDLAVLHLRFGHQRYSVTWSEGSLVIGLVLLPWPWLPLLAPLCIAVAHTLARRSPIKIVFNALSNAAGSALACAVIAYVAPGGRVVDVGRPRTWLALALAAVAFSAWNTGTVAAAVSISQRLPWWAVLQRGAALKVAVLVGNTATAIALATLDWQGAILVGVPVFLLLLYISYRGYLRAMEERDVWQQLESASKELSRLEAGEVASAAVTRALQLFKADEAVIRLWLGTSAQRVVSRRAGSDVVDSCGDVPVSAAAWSGTRRLVSAPLEGAGGQVGSLDLVFDGPVELTERERQVLTTYAHSVATSLQNAGLFEQVSAQAARSAHQASHDPLTGLANRTLLQTHGAGTLATARERGRRAALLLLDLDHFKEINDTLGHPVGDRLLREVAARLDGAVPEAEVVARLGGDEFVVLVSGLGAAEEAETVARHLLALVAVPVDLDEELRLSVEASIGIACYPDDGDTIDELLQRADVAMYRAKGSRGSSRRYRSADDASNVSRLSVAAELRSALDNSELVLHYQPKLDLASRTMVGAEVLVRWQHPVRGLLPPSEFVAVAEDSGLARAFTLEVLRGGVAEAASWRRNGRDVSIAVNLSTRNLLDQALVRDVADVLSRYQYPPDRLVLEITETTMMKDLDVVEEVMRGLRGLGVQLSIDDFGTGYSSLSVLRHAEVDELKIDRSFISGMLQDTRDAGIVRATVALAHDMGLRVVGEGIEDGDVLEALARLGCDVVQGFHISRPQPAADVRRLLGVLDTLPLPRLGATRSVRR